MKYLLVVMSLIFALLSMSGFSGGMMLGSHQVDNPATGASRLPRLKLMPNGNILMSWVDQQGVNSTLKFSVWSNGHWIRQGEVAQGDHWFVNWSDFPSVVAIDEQFWLSHYLVKQAGDKHYDVVLSISNDAGLTWKAIGSPHHGKGRAEFAAIFPLGEDAGIVWLDGRDYLNKEERTKHPEKSGNFNLRYTTVHRDGSTGTEQVIDNNTCTCCWPSVALTDKGPIAAWRGRTDSEIRDNRVSLLRDGRWASPTPLGNEGWEIAGCPVNGPSLAARGNQVVAAWFTAEGERPRVRAAFSNDGGQTFGKPIEIDEIAPLGRISLVWQNDRSAIVSWMTRADSTNKNANLALRVIHTDGSADNIKSVAKVSASRDTGVPQLAILPDGKVMLAWTESAPEYGIKTLVADVNTLKQDVSMQTYLIQKPLPFVAYICNQKH